jgi:tagatose-1,6-bisphosphate aldolase
MDEAFFSRQLGKIIEQVKKSNTGGSVTTDRLVDMLAELSPNNIKERKGAIMHFLVDSFDGSNQVASQLSEFIKACSSEILSQTGQDRI